MATLIAGLLERDSSSGERWLSFARPPPPEVRATLHAAGWLYHGGLRAWRTPDDTAPVPSSVTVGRGGTCTNSSIRPRGGLEVLDLLTRTRTSIRSRTSTNAA